MFIVIAVFFGLLVCGSSWADHEIKKSQKKQAARLAKLASS